MGKIKEPQTDRHRVNVVLIDEDVKKFAAVKEFLDKNFGCGEDAAVVRASLRLYYDAHISKNLE